jgi:hypothetical protein
MMGAQQMVKTVTSRTRMSSSRATAVTVTVNHLVKRRQGRMRKKVQTQQMSRGADQRRQH